MYQFTSSNPDRYVSLQYVVSSFQRALRLGEAHYYYIYDGTNKYRGYINLQYKDGRARIDRHNAKGDIVSYLNCLHDDSDIELAFTIGRLLG